MTVQQINAFIPEVPPATMYRHLNKLLEADIIAVVEENQIRGTIEKVYSLAEKVGEQTNEEILKASREDLFRYFFTFLINLLGEFEKYLKQESFDLMKDGVGFSQAFIYADDDEFMELVKTIGTAIGQVAQNKPTASRKARSIATILIPQVDSTGEGIDN